MTLCKLMKKKIYKLIIIILYGAFEYSKILWKKLYQTINKLEIICIIIANIFDIFKIGCKSLSQKNEAKKVLSLKEIKDASKKINNFIVLQINILKQIKEEEKKKKSNVGEDTDFGGLFTSIQANYKELNNLLNN